MSVSRKEIRVKRALPEFFWSSKVCVKELLSFCPRFPIQSALLLSRRNSSKGELGCKPVHQCLMALCAVWIQSETTLHELRTWVPVNTVRTALILLYVIYFLKLLFIGEAPNQQNKSGCNINNDHSSLKDKSLSAAVSLLNFYYFHWSFLILT